jgi:L-threonylcarbamoyladenylate synthase
MRVITVSSSERPLSTIDEIVELLRSDGLACLPFQRQYGIVAALDSERAVLKLVQSKRRSGSAPALVLVPDRDGLEAIVDAVPPAAEPLMSRFWPGPLTLVFQPSAELAPRVLKTIAAAKRGGRIGVRVPGAGLPLDLVRAFGAPLLASSANLANKAGATSVASVRKSFHHSLDLLVDAGDLPPGPPSTIVDPSVLPPEIVREGAIGAAEILGVLREAGLCE